MLPPFIIDQIRHREREKAERAADLERPRLELPLPRRSDLDDSKSNDESRDRGVIIIEL